MALSTAAAILSRMSVGVPAGACTPAQWAICRLLNPCSIAVGNSG
jgi:hypothetical protein